MPLENRKSVYQHTTSMYTNTVESLPADIRHVYEKMIDWFAQAPMSEGLIAIDAPVADIEIADSNGVSQPLSQWLESGPAIIIFFRSDWCDYCNYYIDLFHSSMPIFKASNTQFFAITPETEFATNDWRRFEEKGFHIVSDPDFNIINEFQIDVELPDFIVEFLQSVDISPSLIEERWKIPLTGVFIINEEQKVGWRLVSQDFRYRATPEDVLNAMQSTLT